MLRRTINTLHIEDDEIQRLRIAHHLTVMNEFQFAISWAASEDAATEAFHPGRTELVILDYQLAQGNGLSCLHKLRRRDATIPIVAVSGVATPEIAAELLQAGADDYLNKHDLDSDILAGSVRHILARTEALRQALFAAEPSQVPRVEAVLRQVCETFRSCASPKLFQQLDELEAAARAADLSAEHLQRLFERACRTAASSPLCDLALSMQQHRPLLLEILVRLFGNAPTGRQKWPA